MNVFECILMALTSLSENKVRSFLTTLGVIIGVMSVILLVSLGEAAHSISKTSLTAWEAMLL